MKFKILDIAILGIGTAAVIAAAVFVYGQGTSETTVTITGQEGEWVYPLKDDRVVEVEGPLGLTHIDIEQGRVHIGDSPCPNQTCVAAGWVEQPGQWLACLPNAVMVRITGGKAEAGIDAGTY